MRFLPESGPGRERSRGRLAPLRPVRPPRRRTWLTPATALAVAFLLLPAGTALAQDEDIDALLSRAVVLHQSGDLEGAVAAYTLVLRAVPQAARVRSNLGVAYAGLGRYDEAIEQYRKALAVEEVPSVRQNLALAFQKTGRTAQAAEEAAKVVTAQPENRDAMLLLADCWGRLGEQQRVVDLLTPAAARAPEDKAVAYLLGTALLNLNRTTEAQAVMDRLFRDESPEAHLLMATMHERRKDWASALSEIEKARAGNPKLPMVNFLYGECLMKQRNDWAGAAAAFRKELEADPNHYESNLLLGTLLREGGSNDEALSYLSRAMRARGDDLAIQYSLGAEYVALGRLDEARPLLERVAVAAPSHLPTHMQLALLYHRLGRAEDAARERTAVQRLQKDAEARSFQGVRESLGDLLGKSAAAPAPTPGPGTKAP